MRTPSVLILCVLSLAALTSCDRIAGHGPFTTETRDTGPFTGVVSEIPGSVELYPGSATGVEVYAQRNIQDVMETRVTDGVLHLYFRRNVHLASHTRIRVVIHLPRLTLVALQGSGAVKVKGTLSADAAELSVAGSGTLYADSVIITGALGLSISGSGSIQAGYLDAAKGKFSVGGSGSIVADAGEVDDLHVDLSGSGDVDLGPLRITDAEVHGSGSGDTRLGETTTLVAYISGSGNVYYRGTPAVTAHVSGSGKVKSW
jgi:hypothetical protein